MSLPAVLPANARDWFADHLHALVWILLALWAPPVIFAVLVDLQLVGGAGTGYPTLRDPGLLLGLLQIAAMAAALPLIHRQRRLRAWQLLCAALGLWAVHAAWTILGRVRLVGLSDLVSRETLVTLAAWSIASIVVCEVRRRFVSSSAVTERPPTGRQPAVLRTDTT